MEFWHGRHPSSGIALFNIVSLIFVMPVVTFYILRDWDHMVAREDSVPRDHRPPSEAVARDRQLLAGVIRGQALVCVFSAFF